jgi:hypothetical protein
MSGLDLYQSQGELFRMLAWAVLTGLCLGGLYDLLRALRILAGLDQKQGSTPLFGLILFFGDLLSALTASVSLILLCYYTNDGLFRAPAVLGMASGFFVYMRTAGRLTVKAEKALSRRLKRVVKTVLGFLRRPLGWLASTARSLARKAWRCLFGKAIDKRRERKARKMAERQTSSDTAPPPRRGTTVFSTRGQP